MGKVKHPDDGPSTSNALGKLNRTGSGIQKRAKKRKPVASSAGDVLSKQTGSTKSTKRTRRPYACKEQTASGWVVESDDCRPSREGNSKSWCAKPAPKNKHLSSLRFNTSAKPLAVAFKRRALSVEDLYSSSDEDGSDWYSDHDEEMYDYASDYEDYEMYDGDDFYDLPYQHVYNRKDYYEYFGGNCDELDVSDGSDLYSSDDSLASDNYYRRHILKGERYDEDDGTDEDYVDKNESNTIIIPYGAAVMHDLSDDDIRFDSSAAQIIELPSSEFSAESKKVEKKVIEKKKPDAKDHGEEEEEHNSSPQTVPINPIPAAYQLFNAVHYRMSLAVLKTPIYMYGHLSVQVLSGRVEMLGYQLDVAEKRTVYASGGYNAINLTPLPTPDSFSRATLARVVSKLKPHFIESDIDVLVKQFDPVNSVLVLLRADLFNATDIVPSVCDLLPEYNLFPTALTTDNGSPFLATEMLLEIALFQPGAKNVPLFQTNPAWSAVQLKSDSRLMVVGGKGSGKSTLCQYLLNRHVKQFGRVLLLDLDIGQPLLFLPETVSVCVVEAPILGVGCFADVQPKKCQLFGSLNVVSSPLVYVQNVRSLVQYCAEQPELKGIPWIINTMGYVVGFGEELTNAIVRLVQPTDLVQLTIPKLPKKQSPLNKTQNYANRLTPDVVNGFKFNILQEEVNSQPNPVEYRFYEFEVGFESSSESFYPPKRRTIAIMAQLVKILGDTAESFADVKPHVALVDDLQILITRDEHRPSKEMLLSTLNATMVYLCEKLPNEQYNCFGVGIVRSVDEKRNVYLLHSLTPEQLAKTNVLALCNTSLPSQVYLQHSPNIEGTVPFLQIVPPTTSVNQSA